MLCTTPLLPIDKKGRVIMKMPLYTICTLGMRIYFKFMFDIQFEGVENIPKNGGFIIASNHRHNFDPIFLSLKMKKQIFYLAKIELFDTPIKNLLFSGIGCIPVSRGKGDTTAIDQAILTIKKDRVLGIFPEGTRSKDGTPLRPKSGIALIAGKSGADILPCAIVFGDRLEKGSKIIVKYGKMIANEELEIDENPSPTQLRNTSKKIMQRILDLLPDTIKESEIEEVC